MVGFGDQTLRMQERGDVFGALAPRYIDDSAAFNATAHFEQLAHLVVRFTEDIRKVGTREIAPQQVRAAEAEAFHDVAGHLRGRRRRQGDHRHRSADNLADIGDHQVIRTEIVTPLRDAMRFIYDDEVHIHPAQPRLEQFGAQALGRNVKEFIVAVNGVVEGDVDLAIRHSGIDGQSRNPAVAQILDLVFHQGDERRNHQADPGAHHRRHLETDGLPAPGRQDRQHIPPGQRLGNNLLLHRPKPVIPPIFL